MTKNPRPAAILVLTFVCTLVVGACAVGLRAPAIDTPAAISAPPLPTGDTTNLPTPVSSTVSGTPGPRKPSASPTPHQATVFLDPGHGGVDTGTIGYTEDGSVVEEKAIALSIATRTAQYLRHDDITVVLSRTNDSLPGSQPSDYAADGTMLTPDGVLNDLQRRIDRANASGAKVLLSIHLNAFDDPSIRGTQTFYDSSRPFAAQNERFATLVQNDLIAAFRAGGYDTPDRGITDDQDLITDRFGTLGDGYHHLVMLGPSVQGHLRPSTMPGALSESLFLSDPAEATAATEPSVQDLIARAYTRAIEQFLRGH